MLRQVAMRIRPSLREYDMLARFGGDEFVLLIPQVEGRKQVKSIAEKLLEIFEQPVTLLGKSYSISVSMGISCYPQDGNNSVTLLKNADAAMYRAKNAGRNCYRFFQQ